MRHLLIAIILLPLSMSAQGFDGGLSCRGHVRVSDRWNADWTAEAAYNNARKDCFWGSLSLGARFAVLDSLHVFVSGTYKMADYIDIDNSDRVAQLTEGLRYVGRYSLVHSFMFEQLRLHYYPSSYSVSCARVSYAVARQRLWGEGGEWRTTVLSQVVANARSEVSGTALLQRVKVGCCLERKLPFHNSSVGIEYIYMVGGKRQTYIGESDNLHRIGLFWSFVNRYNRRD